MTGKSILGKRPQIEFYTEGRYFETTGNKLPDALDDIREASAEFLKQLERLAASHQSSDKAGEGRNGALFSLGCRLQKQGLSDDSIRAVLNAENVVGNTRLHANFAEGALDGRELRGIIKSVLRMPKGVDHIPPDFQFKLLNGAGLIPKQQRWLWPGRIPRER